MEDFVEDEIGFFNQVLTRDEYGFRWWYSDLLTCGITIDLFVEFVFELLGKVP